MERKSAFRAALLFAFAVLAVLPMRAGEYETLYKDLPAALVEPALPVIPERTVSLLDFGGVGDGMTDNTKAFEQALGALKKQGGGHLVVPPGIFLTGPIVLKDRIDLHLERGALLLLDPDKTHHLRKGKVVPGISASRCSDVSITGEGIIDGNGAYWRGVKRGKVSDTEWAEFRRMGGTVADDGAIWYPFDLKAFSNIAETALAQEKMRTHLVRLTDCERVLVRGVTIQNAPKFHLVPQRCRQVVLDGVSVRCPWNAQNGDGIDLMNCTDVLVVGCRVDVGDDGICLKGGAGEAGVAAGPCARILICDNIVFRAHGGFVIGSEFSGGMEDIVVRRNTFSGTDTGLRFKSAPGRGGRCRSILISDIWMNGIRDAAVIFETSYADRPVGSTSAAGRQGADFVPEFSDISIARVVCRDTRRGVVASGTLSTVHDISLSDSIFYYTETATALDDPAMIRLEGVRFEGWD